MEVAYLGRIRPHLAAFARIASFACCCLVKCVGCLSVNAYMLSVALSCADCLSIWPVGPDLDGILMVRLACSQVLSE